MKISRRYRNAQEWVDAISPKGGRVAIVYYFRCSYWWTQPKDIKDGYGEGFGWDCRQCRDTRPGLPTLNAAKRAAEDHARTRHGGSVEVKCEDGTFS